MKDQLDLKVEILDKLYNLLPQDDANKICGLIGELIEVAIAETRVNPFSQLGHSERLRGAA